MKVGIIGAGTWGMAMGHVLERNDHKVFFVRREDKKWPKENAHPDFIVLALPCQVVRERLQSLDVPNAPIISLTKGIEIKTGLSTTQILEEILPEHPRAAISGPNLASEVEKQIPTATVAASSASDLAKQTQELLHQKTFRVYRSSDIIGVELGGALKNIYAIAGGICHGLKLGENALAALVTRCLAEMVRIACVLGAQKETLYGLSGMGDLMLTAYSGISRNHRVGEALARGEKLDHTLKNLVGVAEGVPTAKAVYRIIEKNKIKAPVLAEVYHVLYDNKAPTDALHDLLLRQVEEE